MPDYVSDPRVKQVSFIKLKKFLANLGSVDEDVSSTSPLTRNTQGY